MSLIGQFFQSGESGMPSSFSGVTLILSLKFKEDQISKSHKFKVTAKFNICISQASSAKFDICIHIGIFAPCKVAAMSKNWE